MQTKKTDGTLVNPTFRVIFIWNAATIPPSLFIYFPNVAVHTRIMQQEVTAPLHSAPDLFSVSIDLGNLSYHLSPLMPTSAQTFRGNTGVVAVKHFLLFIFI